jgi:hypothetical protein
MLPGCYLEELQGLQLAPPLRPPYTQIHGPAGGSHTNMQAQAQACKPSSGKANAATWCGTTGKVALS